MGKKVREYKSGDFIFAKVKGYPAWPARVQRLNGKKYFVYFYGTGETANLPPNMIFDYAENKDKFLTKTVKRRDFNDGVKQIEHDFANNVPLEQVIGANAEPPADAANDTANDTGNDTANDTLDDTAMDTTAADETVDESTANATQNDTMVEDSDDAGPLVIDEGKKGKKTPLAKTPAKEPPKGKEAKTPRGKAKKDDAKDEEEAKKEEEIVSRSGRKIRPKRYIDEQTEENSTLPSPLPKKRRGASPAAEKEKDSDKEKEKTEPAKEKSTAKLYNSVTQSELEDLKEPFKQEDAEKDNILIAYLPSGQYVGVKLFQSRPSSFKNEAARLTWDKQSATNSIIIKQQLERGQITSQSVSAQLVMDLNLTDEEKAALDKERETEEKKCRVQFLKTEMKLIELDAKIKTCLCLEKADTELCLKLLSQLAELDIKPLMLLKHPSCVETVKRMRAYVGNTPVWALSEQAAAQFGKQAHRIRRHADSIYTKLKNLFTTPEGLSFWEFFSERVLQFKKATAALSADELLELVHEPLELSTPTAHTMKAAVEAANEQENAEDEPNQKKKATPVKAKKAANSTPSKPASKRQSSRKQQQEEKEKESKKNETEDKEDETEENSEKPTDNDAEKAENEESNKDNNETENSKDTEKDKDKENDNEKNKNETTEESNEKESIEEANGKEQDVENASETKDGETNENDSDKSDKPSETEKKEKQSEKKEKVNDSDKKEKVNDRKDKGSDKSKEDKQEESKEEKQSDKKEKANDRKEKGSDKSKEDKQEESKEDSEKEKEDVAEPRAKRSRESKKTEPPPPRSPAKRKSKC